MFAPLAKLLGVYCMKDELQDLCLKYMEPDIYAHIVKWQEKQTNNNLNAFIKAKKVAVYSGTCCALSHLASLCSVCSDLSILLTQ